jgi:hypothetical protein
LTIAGFLKKEGAVAMLGRALYPSFLEAGEGESSNFWQSLTPRPYSRIGFILIGPGHYDILLPAADPPAYLPHASDVFVLGCKRADYIEAYLIAVLTPAGRSALIQQQAIDWQRGCQPPTGRAP